MLLPYYSVQDDSTTGEELLTILLFYTEYFEAVDVAKPKRTYDKKNSFVNNALSFAKSKVSRENVMVIDLCGEVRSCDSY